jgi:hypothetical protein
MVPTAINFVWMLNINYPLHHCFKIFLDLFLKKFDNIGMEDIRKRIESLLKKTKDERFRYISLLADEIIKNRLAVSGNIKNSFVRANQITG